MNPESFTTESITLLKMNQMSDTLLERITINDNICHGKPTLRGTRNTVEGVLELLASGMSHAEILADYEDLEEDDLKACLLFASKLAKVKHISQLVA